jgi:hypothetical protein
MRAILLLMFLGLSLGSLSACTTPVDGVAVASADAHCDEYEGYPDCYPDHPLDR